MRGAMLAAAALLGLAPGPLTAVPALANTVRSPGTKKPVNAARAGIEQTRNHAPRGGAERCGATGCKIIMRTGRQGMRCTGDE